MFFQIYRCCPVLVHRCLQLLKSWSSRLHQMHFLYKGKSLYHDVSCKHWMKYQNQHRRHTEYVQCRAQIKYMTYIPQICVNKSLPEYRQCHTNHNEYQLICNRHDHQHQCRHRNGDFLFLHIINLRRLSPRSRRCDAAKEKSHRWKQKTGSLFQTYPKCMHHIINDNGFSPDKYHNADNARYQPQGIDRFYNLCNLSQVFSIEYSIDCSNKNHEQKYHIKYCFLFIFHSSSHSIFRQSNRLRSP